MQIGHHWVSERGVAHTRASPDSRTLRKAVSASSKANWSARTSKCTVHLLRKPYQALGSLAWRHQQRSGESCMETCKGKWPWSLRTRSLIAPFFQSQASMEFAGSQDLSSEPQPFQLSPRAVTSRISLISKTTSGPATVDGDTCFWEGSRRDTWKALGMRREGVYIKQGSFEEPQDRAQEPRSPQDC